MKQNSTRRTLLWGLLLTTLIFAINYTKLELITVDEFFAMVFFMGDKINEALKFFLRAEVTAIATIVTLLGAPGAILVIWQMVRKNRQAIENIENQEEQRERLESRSINLDWGNFATHPQPIKSVTASHISIEGRVAIKVANVPIPRRWACPTDRDPLNRQGQAVGRRQELTALGERLKPDTQAVVTVVGMPGLGKSTLASMFIQTYGPNTREGNCGLKSVMNFAIKHNAKRF